MADQNQLQQRALAAREKTAAIGADLDLSSYEKHAATHQALAEEELCTLPAQEQQDLLLSGVDVSGKDRGGTFIMKDASPLHCSSHQEGGGAAPQEGPGGASLALGLLLEAGGGGRGQVHRRRPVGSSRRLHDPGPARAKAIHPIQACLYMDQDNIQQNVHNIIIAEEGAELHIISGCATSPHLKKGLHVGISEFFVKKNAKLSFTMIHNWSEGVAVRPARWPRWTKAACICPTTCACVR